MIPPNTVPIDWQEFQQLLEAPIPVLCFNSLRQHWITVNATNWKYNKEGFEQSEFRIAAHDYRHYFGEVVDLKEYVTGSVLQYMGDAFILSKEEENTYYNLYECIDNGYPDRLILTDIESQCKKIVIQHFEYLFKKDLPHLNIKFIWSN